MDKTQIRTHIETIQRILERTTWGLDRDLPDIVLGDLSLIAQYASLAAHYLPQDQPGVREMRDAWGPANAACDASFRARRAA